MDKPSVLMVDDRPENLLALERLLEDMELDLVSVTSGNAALAELLEKEFALVLLDYQMPEMDGLEVAKLMQANEKTRQTPVIFVTATSYEEESILRAYESGAIDYVVKPIVPVILRSKVRIFTQLDLQRRLIQKQLEEIQVLKGIVPICSHCKNVRDDSGFWESVEVYVSNHSEAEFSHGICPACLKELYPNVAEMQQGTE